MIKNIFLLSLAILFCIPNTSFAQDESSSDSPWQFRLRGIYVSPNESAEIEAIGGDVDISTALVPELDISYFFNENWSAELILGTTKHDVSAVATAAGDIELGDIMLLPPTLTAQYHFTGSDFVPYVGAGLNLTLFYL